MPKKNIFCDCTIKCTSFSVRKTALSRSVRQCGAVDAVSILMSSAPSCTYPQFGFLLHYLKAAITLIQGSTVRFCICHLPSINTPSLRYHSFAATLIGLIAKVFAATFSSGLRTIGISDS